MLQSRYKTHDLSFLEGEAFFGHHSLVIIILCSHPVRLLAAASGSFSQQQSWIELSLRRAAASD